MSHSPFHYFQLAGEVAPFTEFCFGDNEKDKVNTSLTHLYIRFIQRIISN
jgi:hypothetical protein